MTGKLPAVVFCLLIASRVRPGDEAAERIHATPGYPFGVTVGLAFRFLGK